jgi:5-methylcytosine-specific restriction endonuclease McrA
VKLVIVNEILPDKDAQTYLRLAQANAPSEPYTTQQILELYGTDCHICHEPIDLDAPRSVHKQGYQRGLHLDHVIPLSKGGTDLIENVKPSHARCNLSKNGRLLLCA